MTFDPEEGDPLWTDIRKMADEMEKALSRLLDAIHVFERDPRWVSSRNQSAGLKIDPKDGNDIDEIYLVPALYDDSSALLGVEHDRRTIYFLKIYERLLPEEDAPAQWTEIVTLAAAGRAAAKAKRTSTGDQHVKPDNEGRSRPAGQAG